jgi:hypothetical protein
MAKDRGYSRASPRTLLQGFVIALLILFDQTFQAEVTADLIAKLLALQEEQYLGNTTVSVAKRMDTEKVEVKRHYAIRGWTQRSSRQCPQSETSFAMFCGISTTGTPELAVRQTMQSTNCLF